MPYLMEISFDNDRRLKRKYYLFEYKGIRFKLIQDSPRKWADHLLTILPNGNEDEKEQAYSVASEFLSALGWQNWARVAVWECGGRSWHKEWPISRARSSMRTYPRIPFGGSIVGYNIDSIPKIETEEQKIALTLYREARASNNNYLSFLFYWQVLETGGTNAEGYVNNVQKKQPRELQWVAKDIANLPLCGRRLGEYLRDEGRDAIAHIRRNPGKKKLELDKTKEQHRISTNTRIIQRIAEYYIKNHLNLDKQLYLKRRGNRGFPTFVSSEDCLQGTWYFPAYK